MLKPLPVAMLAMFAPFIGLHGIPRLASGDRQGGFIRLAAGLLLVALVVFAPGPLIGLLIFDPVMFIVVGLVILGAYFFLWGEGLVYAWRRLPPYT